MDKYFLQQLASQTNRETYVRITTLNNQDLPLETIEGKVSGGSINVDGASAVRRTCSLNLLTSEDSGSITEPYWCFNTKFKVEIGETNYIDATKAPIIWFDMGIYLISSFSASESAGGLNISIQGKDKMCRLNGEMGGTIPSQWDWGQIEEVDYENNITTLTKIPVKDIIFNAVRQFSLEPIHNIIINDLDTVGYELWEYAGRENIYYLKNSINGQCELMVFSDTATVYYNDKPITLDKVPQYWAPNSLDNEYNLNASKVTIEAGGSNEYYVIQVQPGETAGYHQIPLVYNSDLISKAGETVTQVLDKIKNMLGNFEYFYDLQGRFVFQKKKDYIQELYSTSTGGLTTPALCNDFYSYVFEDKSTFTSLSNSTNLGNIKNDFIVWGTRAIDSLPIHARCAIDQKPKTYCSPWETYIKIGASLPSDIRNNSKIFGGYYVKNNKQYSTAMVSRQNVAKVTKNDKEYVLTNNLQFYPALLTSGNENDVVYSVVNQELWGADKLPEALGKSTEHYLMTENLQVKWTDPGAKGQEQFIVTSTKTFEDIEGTAIEVDEVKNPLAKNTTDIVPFTWLCSSLEGSGIYLYAKLQAGRVYDTKDNNTAIKSDWREVIYQMALDFRKHGTESNYYVEVEKYNLEYTEGRTGYEQYYIDLEGFWRQLYNPFPSLKEIEDFYNELHETSPYWNKNIHLDPNRILFWFEMFDTQGELSKYSISQIGCRPKVVNENTVTSIYNKPTPEVQFIVADTEEYKQANTAYVPMQITSNDTSLFYRSSQGNSAINRINEMLFQFLNLTESATITSSPIYYLQPNTRIKLAELGDYTISKLTYNLNYNGTMNITAVKIYKQFN